ncbi:MAG: glutamate ligase domain-containing protein, partial [Dolichospermum sp.]
LAAANLQSRPGQRVVAIFQPHRYTRTLTFLEEFAESFTHADLVVLTDIYSAGEPDLGQVSGEDLATAISKHNPQVVYQPNLPLVSEFLLENLRSGDLALFLGAGNLNQTIPELITTMSEPAKSYI